MAGRFYGRGVSIKTSGHFVDRLDLGGGRDLYWAP